MDCKRCGTRMKDGHAMVPGYKRDGLYYCRRAEWTVMRPVKKCPGCWHSVSFEATRLWMTEEE